MGSFDRGNVYGGSEVMNLSPGKSRHRHGKIFKELARNEKVAQYNRNPRGGTTTKTEIRTRRLQT